MEGIRGGATPPSFAPPETSARPVQSTSRPKPIYLLPSEIPNHPSFNLLGHVKAYPCYLHTTTLAYLKHDGHDASDLARGQRYRRRLIKALESLRDKGVIHYPELRDSLISWRLTENGLNLIRHKHLSNSSETGGIGDSTPFRRLRKERQIALNLTAKERMLTPENRHQVRQQYDTYLQDVTDRSVILCHKEDEQNPDAPLYFLPYRTRFTDFSRKKKNLDTYEAIWKHASLGYKSAVFITLTTDPKLFRSVFEANIHFQKALNRFFSLIQKRKGFRPKYLNVHEFTEKGLLHSHIVLFGIDYLSHFRQLSKDWQKCGQGSIVHIYGLRNNGTAWTWSRAQPKGAKAGRSVDLYLKKYLKKSLFEADELELYWTFNKRFFTHSKALRPASAPPGRHGPAFVFIGSAPSDMIAVILARRSRHLWSQARAAEYPASTGPPSF